MSTELFIIQQSTASFKTPYSCLWCKSKEYFKTSVVFDDNFDQVAAKKLSIRKNLENKVFV